MWVSNELKLACVLSGGIRLPLASPVVGTRLADARVSRGGGLQVLQRRYGVVWDAYLCEIACAGTLRVQLGVEFISAAFTALGPHHDRQHCCSGRSVR